MQILLSGHMDRFASMQNLQIEYCTWSRPSAKFAYTQILHIRKSGKNCGHMDRFAYVSKICVNAKFAYVSKSVHVTSPLLASIKNDSIQNSTENALTPLSSKTSMVGDRNSKRFDTE